MNITEIRLNKYINDNNLRMSAFDTQFAVHRTCEITKDKILGIHMEKGVYSMKYIKGDTHIWIRDLTKHESCQTTDVFRGKDYDALLDIDLIKIVNDLKTVEIKAQSLLEPEVEL